MQISNKTRTKINTKKFYANTLKLLHYMKREDTGYPLDLHHKQKSNHLWIPFSSKAGQMPIEIMAVHDLSAWGFQIPKDGIPYTNAIVLRGS